jgi:hypothetical protein
MSERANKNMNTYCFSIFYPPLNPVAGCLRLQF